MRLAEIPTDLFTLRGDVLTGMSEADFFRFCQANPTLQIERTAAQEIIIMPPAYPDSSESTSEINGQLWLWNRQARTGHTYESSAGFRLPNKAVRAPDVAWLSTARRAAALAANTETGFFPTCPEFVVEVKSPSDTLRDLQAKMEEYLANGALLGFLLDTETATAHVYRPGQPPEILTGFDRDLSGEPVLPGFRLDLRPLRRAPGE